MALSHHLWIDSLFTSILFSMIGLLLTVLVSQDLDVVLIASLSFMSAIVIVGLAFEACKRKSRLSSVLLLIVFVVATGLLAYLSSDIYTNHGGFWSLSAEILGIPMFKV